MNMEDICEAESCNNKAEYYDETDNRICEEHMHQDMEETGNESSDYERINKEAATKEKDSQKQSKGTLGDMIEAMADAFTKERQKKEPYKELFKAGSTHTGLLRELESKMTDHVLDACDVYKERYGANINKNQFHVLLALPLLVKIAEQDAKKNEGMACCVDKAYFMISEQFKALGAESERKRGVHEKTARSKNNKTNKAFQQRTKGLDDIFNRRTSSESQGKISRERKIC